MRPLFSYHSFSMINSSLPLYWRAARSPRYSLSFAFPLLLLYEALAFSLSHGQVVEVRNGADVLLKNLFVLLGGRAGLVLFGAVLIGGGLAFVWRDMHKAGRIKFRFFAWMAAESVVYALSFGLVAGTLTGLLLPPVALLSETGVLFGSFSRLSLPTQLMVSLGAGIYEELLFRVILVSGLAWVAARVFRWTPSAASIFAVLLGALIFAAFHYVGPYGDRLDLGSFAFRTVAGLLFSGLYLVRGFGITAWTHALYDVFLAVG
jgi:CAAX prenyl protease-like protein